LSELPVACSFDITQSSIGKNKAVHQWPEQCRFCTISLLFDFILGFLNDFQLQRSESLFDQGLKEQAVLPSRLQEAEIP